MLSDKQRQHISASGCHTMHDYRFASLIYGEAFLEDDMLVYFDGRMLTLCAYALNCTASLNRSQIREWVLHWVKRTGAESMMLITPVCPDLRVLNSFGFQRILTCRAQAITQEVIAACPSENSGAPRRRLLRRALAAPYKMEVRSGGDIDARKLALIERFTRITGMTLYLEALTIAWPAILMDERMRFIEAWRDGSLMGFIAMHQAFEHGGVAIAMARHPRARGVTDFLYAHMLIQAPSMGCKWINLCSSSTQGQHVFKLKWGTQSPLAAYALTEWGRAVIAHRNLGLWATRIIRLPARIPK